MAKSTLPVNFTDDVLNESMSGNRRFKLIYNDDGTVSLEDVTAYDQIGSNFGSKQVNETNEAVNAAADAGKIIDSLATARAVTEEGYMAGALALKELDESLEWKEYLNSIINDNSNFTKIQTLLNILEEKELVVISYMYGINGCKELNQQDIAKILGMQQGSVSRIGKRAINKMKYYLKVNRGVDYGR